MAVERIGARWAGHSLEAAVNPQIGLAADRLLAATWPGSPPPIGWHLSDKWLDQGWTVDQLAGLLARVIEDQLGTPMLVTHGPSDAHVAGALLALPGFRVGGGTRQPLCGR